MLKGAWGAAGARRRVVRMGRHQDQGTFWLGAPAVGPPSRPYHRAGLPRLLVNSARLPNQALGLLYMAGGLFALTSIVVPHGKAFGMLGAVLATVVAGLVGAVVWRAKPLTERWVHLLVDLAGLLLCGGLLSGRHTPLSMSSAVFLVWVALAAALFLPPARAAVQVAAISVAFAVVMGVIGGPAAPAEAVYVLGTACVAAAVTAYNRAGLMVMAKTDFLTGLPNREEMYALLEVEMARSARTGGPLAVAMLDLDGFKEVNDRCGHHAGDRALVELAGLWSSNLRGTDIVARFGGDEFVVVMPSTEGGKARQLLSRLSAAGGPCGWSAGVAVWDGAEDVNHLLARADAALYGQKAARPPSPALAGENRDDGGGPSVSAVEPAVQHFRATTGGDPAGPCVPAGRSRAGHAG